MTPAQIMGTVAIGFVAWLYFVLVRPLNRAVDRHLERVRMNENPRRELARLTRRGDP